MVYARPFARQDGDEDKIRKDAQQRLNDIQEEMMQTQIKYQKELEKLEKENRELRKQNLLLKQVFCITAPNLKLFQYHSF